MLHLRANSSIDSPAAVSAFAERPFKVRGRLVDGQGLPVADVRVVLADARGSFSYPGVSDANGDFEVSTFGVGRRIEGASLIAVGDAGVRYLGSAANLSASAVAPMLDFDPTTAAIDALTLMPATHHVRATIDVAAAGMAASTRLLMLGPGGVALSLPDLSGDAYVANLPGVSYAIEASAADVETGVESRMYRDNLGIDFSRSETVFADALLAPPAAIGPVSLDAAGILRWQASVGARGYRLSLVDLGRSLPLWEAFTRATQVRVAPPLPGLVGPQALPVGRYRMLVAAWDEQELTERHVAAVGPRALRLLPVSTGFRMASREFTFEVP